MKVESKLGVSYSNSREFFEGMTVGTVFKAAAFISWYLEKNPVTESGAKTGRGVPENYLKRFVNATNGLAFLEREKKGTYRYAKAFPTEAELEAVASGDSAVSETVESSSSSADKKSSEKTKLTEEELAILKSSFTEEEIKELAAVEVSEPSASIPIKKKKKSAKADTVKAEEKVEEKQSKSAAPVPPAPVSSDAVNAVSDVVTTGSFGLESENILVAAESDGVAGSYGAADILNGTAISESCDNADVDSNNADCAKADAEHTQELIDISDFSECVDMSVYMKNTRDFSRLSNKAAHEYVDALKGSLAYYKNSFEVGGSGYRPATYDLLYAVPGYRVMILGLIYEICLAHPDSKSLTAELEAVKAELAAYNVELAFF